MEPNSSSEVEPYSGGRRLHLLLLDTVMTEEEGQHRSVYVIVILVRMLFMKLMSLLMKSFVTEASPSFVVQRQVVNLYFRATDKTKIGIIVVL